MQTFLPYPSFPCSLAILDNKRLGKQRVEAKQILRALEFGPYQYEDTEDWFVHPTPSSWISCTEDAFRMKAGPGRYRRTPWYNHPATKMWRGYETALALYGSYACTQWISHGFRDSLHQWFEEHTLGLSTPDICLPPWISNPEFTLSHQSNLVRKDPAHYRQFFPDVPDNLPYVWPSP